MTDPLHCGRCFAALKKLAPLRQVSGLYRKTSTSAPVLPNGELKVQKTHVKSPNKADSPGDFGIKLSEYAKSVANEDEFFIAPD